MSTHSPARHLHVERRPRTVSGATTRISALAAMTATFIAIATTTAPALAASYALIGITVTAVLAAVYRGDLDTRDRHVYLAVLAVTPLFWPLQIMWLATTDERTTGQ